MAVPENEKAIYWPLTPKVWQWGRVYARGALVDGLREGPWTFWYAGGQKQMEGAYKKGVKTGTWTRYWENGKPQSRGAFDDAGRMHGPWTDWFANGGKAQESAWEHGRRSGETVLYDRDSGKVLKKQRFDPSKEADQGFDLLTDRDAAHVLQCAQKARMAASWSLLVGKRVARLMEPWQAGLWILMIIPLFALFSKNLGLGPFSVPAAALASGALSLGIDRLARVHDRLTRPDQGVAARKQS